MRTNISWRLGWPGWRFAARLGLPIRIKIDVCHDWEADVYFAVSPAIGLAVEAQSLDTLMKEIETAVPELITLEHASIAHPRTDIRFHDDFVTA